MKRVACLSTIQSLPNDTSSSSHVIDIFNSTRAYNLEHQITGAFIVFNQHLLMVVEGESTHLANIIFKTRQDSRLKEFSLIMNCDIPEPEFTSWGIKLLRQNNDGQERFYEKLNNIFDSSFQLENQRDKKRLNLFLYVASTQKNKADLQKITRQDKTIDTTTSADNVNTANKSQASSLVFNHSMISLTGWPKPGKIKLCPELIKICARLVGRPHRYEDLLKEKLVATESTLQNYLTDLNSLGILRMHNVDEKPNLVGITGGLSKNPKPSSGDRFSTVLRNFLSASKR